MSITEGWEKIKPSDKDTREKRSSWFGLVFIVLTLFLVGSASFGLGRLSTLEERRVPVRIEQNQDTEPPNNQDEKSSFSESDKLQEGGLVASRNSDVYHFPWCPGAQRITEENKIYFSSVEEARSSGYRPAGNCKGLE